MRRRIQEPDRERFADISAQYDCVYLIVSPPRCGSTVLSRVFWEQPSVRYYSHEPFERMYYGNLGLDSALHDLANPIDLTRCYKPKALGGSLLVKAITFQVGAYAPRLFQIARAPVLFLIRNPEVSIRSKIRGRLEIGLPVPFPERETGWQSLADQAHLAEASQVPYFVVDFADLQNSPAKILSSICRRWGLPNASPSFAYTASPDFPLDNLGGVHMHFYQRALTSPRIEKAEFQSEYAELPEAETLKTHIEYCQGVYEALRRSPFRIGA